MLTALEIEHEMARLDRERREFLAKLDWVFPRRVGTRQYHLEMLQHSLTKLSRSGDTRACLHIDLTEQGILLQLVTHARAEIEGLT